MQALIKAEWASLLIFTNKFYWDIATLLYLLPVSEELHFGAD